MHYVWHHIGIPEGGAAPKIGMLSEVSRRTRALKLDLFDPLGCLDQLRLVHILVELVSGNESCQLLVLLLARLLVVVALEYESALEYLVLVAELVHARNDPVQ
jgi:hypothetical protein